MQEGSHPELPWARGVRDRKKEMNESKQSFIFQKNFQKRRRLAGFGPTAAGSKNETPTLTREKQVGKMNSGFTKTLTSLTLTLI